MEAVTTIWPDLLPLHVAGGGLHRRKDRLVRLTMHDLVPFGGVDGVDLPGFGQVAGTGADAGIGEHGVEPAALLRSRVDGGAQRRQIRHIQFDPFDRGAGPGKAVRLHRQRCRIDIRHDDMGAVVGHRLGHGEPQAAGGAGDKGGHGP